MSAARTIPLPPELVDAVADNERVIMTRDGTPVAAVVPIEDLEALEAAEDAADEAAYAEALAEWEKAGRPLGAPLEALAARWGITLDPDKT